MFQCASQHRFTIALYYQSGLRCGLLHYSEDGHLSQFCRNLRLRYGKAPFSVS